MFHFIGSINATPWANGIALIVLVYFTAKISGSHLNPAVSTSFMMLGYINPLEMLVYWIAQICGCMVGSLWIAALVPQIQIGEEITKKTLEYSGCFIPQDGLSYAQVYGWEAVCTFCFMLPIFAVVWYTQNKSGYGNTGPFIVGCSFMASAYVAAPFTGAAFNPARVLGSTLVFKCPDTQFVKFYILGEFTAGLIIPFFVLPWYGIALENWYFTYFPSLKKKFAYLYKDEEMLIDLESPKIFKDKRIQNILVKSPSTLSVDSKGNTNANANINALKVMSPLYSPRQSPRQSPQDFQRRQLGNFIPKYPNAKVSIELSKKITPRLSLDGVNITGESFSEIT